MEMRKLNKNEKKKHWLKRYAYFLLNFVYRFKSPSIFSRDSNVKRLLVVHIINAEIQEHRIHIIIFDENIWSRKVFTLKLILTTSRKVFFLKFLFTSSCCLLFLAKKLFASVCTLLKIQFSLETNLKYLGQHAVGFHFPYHTMQICIRIKLRWCFAPISTEIENNNICLIFRF